MMEVKVSINLITFNRAGFVSRAIDSILAQTFSDWELIIIDDASTDDTKNLISRYLSDGRIKYFRNDKNSGIVFSRNRALSLSGGEYVAVLDSDDAWSDKTKLKKQVEFLDSHPEYCLVGGNAEIMDETGRCVEKYCSPEKDEAIRKVILIKNPFVHSSVLYRRKIAVESGGYGDFKVGEDYDLFLKMGLKGKVSVLPEFSVKYSRHSGGATWENRLCSARQHLKIIKNYKNNYPNYCLALLKSYLRIFMAFLKAI